MDRDIPMDLHGQVVSSRDLCDGRLLAYGRREGATQSANKASDHRKRGDGHTTADGILSLWNYVHTGQ